MQTIRKTKPRGKGRARHFHSAFNCIDCGVKLSNPREFLCFRCKAGKELFLALDEYMRVSP
jgi:hypothetical protein